MDQPQVCSAVYLRDADQLVRMVDQGIVREQFYLHTPAEGTPEEKGHFRRQKFLRALDWAEQKQLPSIWGEVRRPSETCRK
jgi:hypothetical protein